MTAEFARDAAGVLGELRRVARRLDLLRAAALEQERKQRTPTVCHVARMVTRADAELASVVRLMTLAAQQADTAATLDAYWQEKQSDRRLARV
jgi:hypothetical protein